MRVACSIIIAALASFVGTSMAAEPDFSVNNPQMSRLSVAWNEQAQSKFGLVAAGHPELAAGAHYAIAVANLSDTPVMALTVRWRWTDGQGIERTHDQRQDAYIFPTNAPVTVVAPHKTTVIMPGIFAPEQPSGVFTLSGLSRIEDTIQQFQGSSKVTASIDCVIFSDGVMVGPNESQTLEGIQARRRVAIEIGQLVVNTVNAKQSVPAAMDKYLHDSAGKGTPSDYVWRQRLANRFKNPAMPEDFVLRIANEYMAIAELPAAKR